jgi:hypothetical protein
MFKRSAFYVRDGALIGDLQDALQPMVWRMELSRVHAAGFRVVPDGPHWDLVIESGKGDAQTIASYASQTTAQKALRRMSSALQRQEWGRFVSRLVIFFIVVLALYLVLNFLANTTRNAMLSRVGVGAPVATAPIAQGQSQSADQVLAPPPR